VPHCRTRGPAWQASSGPAALQELAFDVWGAAVHPGHLQPGAVRPAMSRAASARGGQLVLAGQAQPQAGFFDQQAELRPQAGQVARGVQVTVTIR
jgi:hypothetical protein